jgi:hypothetical protein
MNATTEESKELTQPGPPPEVVNPFEKKESEHLAYGNVAIESERAVAETQAKLMIALRFPRDLKRCIKKASEAARRYEFAKDAFYAYKRGSDTIRGPSIRMAEELARCWGNFEYGLRELSNSPGRSEMEAFAWDYEANLVSSQRFTVKHSRDTKKGKYDLKDERDIYEVTANMGARRMRARILAALPADYVDLITKECDATIKREAHRKPVEERVGEMLPQFVKLGVTQKQIEEYLKHPVLACTQEEVDSLGEIFRAIRDGEQQASEWFGSAAPVATPPAAQKPDEPAPAAEVKPEEKAKRAKKEKPADVPEGQRVTQTEEKKAPEAKPPMAEAKPPPASPVAAEQKPKKTAGEDLF